MLVFQTYQVCWLSNHRCQGIQFQGHCTGLSHQISAERRYGQSSSPTNSNFCLYLGLLSAFSEEK